MKSQFNLSKAIARVYHGARREFMYDNEQTSEHDLFVDSVRRLAYIFLAAQTAYEDHSAMMATIHHNVAKLIAFVI
ncbi:MAG TPA: hypothetical protein DCR55_17890 [Lentisphaeria bacterium]|nr:hypothetical protein [Lentisphaeria bacterium]